MRSFFTEMTGKQRLLFVLFIVSVVCVLLAYYWQGVIQAMLISALILAILFITKGIWLPDNYGNTLIRRLSLGIVSLVLLTSTAWNNLLDSLVIKPGVIFLRNNIPSLKDLDVPSSSPTIEVLLFSFFVIFIVNYLSADRTAMVKHSEPIDKEFPEKNYKSRLKAFCEILRRDLDDLNRETNWSEEFFTPLDAEVEIRTESTKKKKVTDLLSALKKDRKSKALLILGDPGSGKSVALRKLCTELLNEVQRTGKVPIYINLREWEVKNGWNEADPPTVGALYEFVVQNLKNRGDIFASEFIDAYFKKMYEHGRVFFLLDSFDEIPAVLDVDESSWLIDALSSTIHKFLVGAHDSRGVLTSRIFRKPTQKFNATTILEIRPFTEEKILKRFKKSIGYDSKLEKLVFFENQHFIPVARNPFSASLILNYAKKNDYTLPKNQVDLYDNYISERLNQSSKYRTNSGLSNEQISEAIIEIAFYMFSKANYGLEAPKGDLIKAIPKYPIDAIVEHLCFCRLGRLGGGDGKLFSFVHRRFNEFLVSKKLIQDKALVPKDSIPTDSRWRDSLVLYCEISTEDDAKTLADFCWNEIKIVKDENLTIIDPRYRRAIHSLRFLNEAFRNRIDSIGNFQSELSEFVLNQINGEKLLETKLSIESVGIMDHQQTDVAVCQALKLNNGWIGETALRSCRHLPQLSDQLYFRIVKYLLLIKPQDIIKRKEELLFSFSLSDGFKNIRSFFRLVIYDAYAVLLATFLMFIVAPLIAVLLIILYLFFIEIIMELRIPVRIDKGEKSKIAVINLFIHRFIFFFRAQAIAFILMLSRNNDFLFDYQFIVSSKILYNGLTLITLFLLFPWLDIYVSLKIFRKRHIRPLLKVMLLYGIAVSIVAMGGYMFITFVPEYLQKIFIACFMTLVGAYFIIIAIREMFDFFRDLLYSRKVNMSDIISREKVEFHLFKFKTPYGRLIFLNKLSSQPLKISGSWKDSKIPNFNDRASTVLAKLEEKWLGFDR